MKKPSPNVSPARARRADELFWRAAKLLGLPGSFVSRRGQVVQVIVPDDLSGFESLKIDEPTRERLIAEEYLEPTARKRQGDGERWSSRSVRA